MRRITPFGSRWLDARGPLTDRQFVKFFIFFSHYELYFLLRLQFHNIYNFLQINNFHNINLDQWLEDQGECLYQAISFGWEIPNDDEGDCSTFTWANHEGVEGVLLA